MILAAMAVNLILIGAPQEEEAAGDAKKWLALLDDHKYEESWTQASEMFRSQVSQEQWIAALKRSREPLGSTVSRTRTRLQFSKTLRGAPDADYAILHYETSFSSKTGTERLTLVKEDGKWKMVAFGIY
jgi:Protein of unknown function (DUF4019)